MDSPRCQNPACGQSITVVHGHRARKYCNDNCKQAAYLARQDAAKRARIAAEEAETLRLEMAALRERWGDLLPETVRQLKMLKDRTRIEIADQLVAVIKAEMAQESNNAADLKEEQAKYAALLADYMQSAKKIANLERQVHRIERMEILKSRESMLHELMLLGGRLKYCSMTDLGIDEGIDAWLNYIRGASDEQLSVAIAHGFYQADQLAMQAIEAFDMQQEIRMRQRIDTMERDVTLRDERIAELEYGKGQEAGYALLKQDIEQRAQRIEELEREVREKVTKIHRLEESHGSTMYHMNLLLAQAQTAPHEVLVTEQQLEKDLDAVRINTASEDLLKTAYGQALSIIKECEAEIAHLKRRISKQYERRIAKQQARIEELERQKTPASSDRATMAARLMSIAERLHYCRLLVPHINPGVESWGHFVEQASYAQLCEAVEHAEHYYKNLVYLDELDQGMRKEAREKKAS